MPRRLTLSLLCLSVAALSGCGTLVNMQEQPPARTAFSAWPGDHIPTQRIFGGVRCDLANAGALVGRTQCFVEPWAVAALVDVPFSFVGDILTLPITTYATWERVVGKPHGYREGYAPASASPDSVPGAER
jgi:uncharacterized protein YceK